MDFGFHITGDTIVISNFEHMQKMAGNMRPAFSKIADLMQKSQEMNFQRQGTRFGNKWAARKKAAAHPLMIKTGKLSRSFTSSHTDSSATVENTAKHAAFHQRGTRYLPIRNLIGWNDSATDSDLSAIIRVLRQHIGVEA